MSTRIGVIYFSALKLDVSLKPLLLTINVWIDLTCFHFDMIHTSITCENGKWKKELHLFNQVDCNRKINGRKNINKLF